MRKLVDLTGKKFGRLTVIERSESKWLCKCDCGNTKLVNGGHLVSGDTKSCGCLRNEQRIKHGMRNTRLYSVWHGMKERCYNTKHKHFKDYGGRGITICDKWKNDFNAFAQWALSHGYADNLTIDRIDVNGNYEPSNCRFITNAEQQKNKRNSKSKGS